MTAVNHEVPEREAPAPAVKAREGTGRVGAAVAPARTGRPRPTSPAQMLSLQRAAGNRAVSATMRRPPAPASAGVEEAAAQRVAADTDEQVGFAPDKVPGKDTAAAPPAGTGGAAGGDGGGAGAGTGGTGGAGTGGAGGAGTAGAGGAGGSAGAAGGATGGGAPAGAGTPEVAALAGAGTAGAGTAGAGTGGAAAGPGTAGATGPGPAGATTPESAAAAGPAAAAEAATAAAAIPKPPSMAASMPAPSPPAEAKKPTTVNATPSPQQAKTNPPRIDTTAQPGDMLRVVGPPVGATAGLSTGTAAGRAQPELAADLPTPETLAAQRQPGGGGGGATPAPPGASDAPIWSTWTLDDVLSGGRTVLEVSRFIPGWGLLGGLAADSIGAYQDLTSIPPGEYPITTLLVGLRSGVNIVNNGVGHLLYVGQLIQDGLSGSVIGAEFVPVSAAAIEAVAGVKVALDTVLFYADLGVEIGALWNQSHSGPDQWAAWQGVIDGYQANLVGDVVGLVLDTITLSNAGAANVDTVKAGTGIFNTASILAQKWGSTLIAFVQGMFNVWGSKLPGISGEQVPIGTRPPAPATASGGGSAPSGPPAQRLGEDGNPLAEALAMRAAAGWLNLQASQGRAAWQTVDTGLGLLEEEAAKKMAELDAVVKQLSGGKNLFQVIKEGSLSALGHMREKVEHLEKLEAAATDAKANGDQVKTGAEEVLAKVDSLEIPDVTVSPADFGDNALADAAEWIADQASSAATAALNALIARVRSGLDEAKAEIRTPVEAVRDNAVEIGEFFALVAKTAGQQTASIKKYITNFEQGLAKCNGFEDAVNLIIQQVTQLLGAPSFKVGDIRAFWQSLPGYFDQIDGLAGRLVTRAEQLEAQTAVQTFPETAAPPPDPDDEAGGGAAVAGRSATVLPVAASNS